MASFIFDDGISVKAWRAAKALRVRVSISAIGSVVFIFLPARLCHARHLTLQCQLTEADTAHTELANVATRAATQTASVVVLHLELRLSLPFLDVRLCCQAILPLSADRRSSRPTTCSCCGQKHMTGVSMRIMPSHNTLPTTWRPSRRKASPGAARAGDLPHRCAPW